MTMLAGRLNLASHTFSVTEVERPVPSRGQVLVKVAAAGICLSDLHLIDGDFKPSFNPTDVVTLGHEVAGIIDTVGEGVPAQWTPGRRVVLQAGERCRRCAACVRGAACNEIRTRGVDYDGGWAEYALATHHTLVPIPDDMPFEQAAIIPDAVSTPWAAITVTAQIRPAEAVGVWGIGGLGAHAVQILRMVGAAPIIALDPLPEARERALSLGADTAIDPLSNDVRQQVRDASSGRGLDAAFDMAGSQAAREQASSCLGSKGRLVLVGITPGALSVPNGMTFTYRQHQILGHYGSEPDHISELVDLVRLGRLQFSRSISGILPLAEAAAGVARLRSKAGAPIRLILRP